MVTCRMEIPNGAGWTECRQPARWRHKKWPRAVYCDAHQRALAVFIKDGWQEINRKESNGSQLPGVR